MKSRKQVPACREEVYKRHWDGPKQILINNECLDMQLGDRHYYLRIAYEDNDIIARFMEDADCH